MLETGDQQQLTIIDVCPVMVRASDSNYFLRFVYVVIVMNTPQPPEPSHYSLLAPVAPVPSPHHTVTNSDNTTINIPLFLMRGNCHCSETNARVLLIPIVSDNKR